MTEEERLQVVAVQQLLKHNLKHTQKQKEHVVALPDVRYLEGVEKGLNNGIGAMDLLISTIVVTDT